MVLPDVNVLVYAYRTDAPGHAPSKAWLEAAVGGDEAFGLADIVLGGFLRVVTHPGIFRPPSPMEHALTFVEALRGQPNCVPVSPGARHWQIVERLCDGPAWVPAHFHLEVGNGLLTGLRRGRLTTDQARTAVVALGALPIEVDLDTSRRALSESWPLAARRSLTTYDAAYLELAI